MSTFWSLYIIVLVLVNLVGCAALLWWNRKMNAVDAARETTGHVFDGIEERNTPLPRWWLWMFVLSLVFSAIYFALYPGFGSFPGLLGWTQADQWEQEVAFAKRQTDPLFEEFAKVPVDELVAKPEYHEALEVGSRLFANHCAVCHGSDARGAKGFPNLADDAWLYGGSASSVITSIAQGRHGMMPPMAAAIGGTDEAVRDMALYVASLSRPELKEDPGHSAAIDRAAPRFAVCGGCHGADGTGNTMLGAPNLTDSAWLHGGSLADIEKSIREGRSGEMPAHEKILSPERIHVLAAYVLSLSREERNE